MKKILFPIFAVAISQLAIAQMKEGKVIYENVMQMNFVVQGGNPGLANNFPKSRTSQFELLFGKNQTLYQTLPDINQEASQMQGPAGGGPVGTFIRFGDNVTYHNFESGKRVSERELSSKTYVVEEPITKLNWKLTEESKTILGHRVFKATADRYSTRTMMSMENGAMKRREMPDTAKVVAWFAADIPVAGGPEFQGQLPGLILELDINNGRNVYKAIELSPKVNIASIKAPSRGKKISPEEYEKEEQKMIDQIQQNRMRRTGGSGERVTITAN